MYISCPVLGQANESVCPTGKWMKLIPVEEWCVCVWGCVSVGMVWVKCGALAPSPQFYAPLPLFSAALALGKLIYWCWSGVRSAHALLEGQLCKPAIALTSFYSWSAYLTLCKKVQASGADMSPWWKLLGFFCCLEAIFARALCSWVLSFSVWLILGKMLQLGKPASLDLGLSCLEVEGSSRQ